MDNACLLVPELSNEGRVGAIEERTERTRDGEDLSCRSEGARVNSGWLADSFCSVKSTNHSGPDELDHPKCGIQPPSLTKQSRGVTSDRRKRAYIDDCLDSVIDKLQHEDRKHSPQSLSVCTVSALLVGFQKFRDDAATFEHISGADSVPGRFVPLSTVVQRTKTSKGISSRKELLSR